jgi:predicted  nucleic acid-binding Zn-ribbon protein
LSSSDNTVKKIEADLKRLQDEIVNLNLASEQLAKEIIKNDEAG